MPRLYGSLDFKSGHYRRYGREHLVTVVEQAGFDVVDVHHFDVAGVVPYWFMYRLLDVSRLDRFSSDVYDRVVVPVSRMVQRTLPDAVLVPGCLSVRYIRSSKLTRDRLNAVVSALARLFATTSMRVDNAFRPDAAEWRAVMAIGQF